jgi:putative CRISPR-associated protein (TIGR02619 family)
MPRHLIVTCGTSQIEDEKIKALSRNVLPEMKNNWEQLTEFVNEVKEEPAYGISDVSWKEDLEILRHSETLTRVLASYMPKLSEMVRQKNNVFGGEITTLFQMAKQEEPVFNPAEDTLTLLYSDTRSGAFCMATLHQLLVKEEPFKMSPSNLTPPFRIAELREEPSDIEAAEKNTHEAILKSRKEGEGIQNIFVVTGGFKSILPAVTTYALVFGDEMYYLFEKSEQLRRLDPSREVSTDQRIFKLSVKRDKKANQIDAKMNMQIEIPPDRIADKQI